MKVKHLFFCVIILLHVISIYYLFEIGQPTKNNNFPLYEVILAIHVSEGAVLSLVLIVVICDYLRDNWNKTILKIKNYEN